MIIRTHFKNNGVPALNLTPLLTLWDSTNNKVLDNITMTELEGGFYSYTFNNVIGEIYCGLVDGGPLLADLDRYNVIDNTNFSLDVVDKNITQIKSIVEFIKQLENGRWKISNNQMIFYGQDNSTIISKFNLYDNVGNPSESNVMERILIQHSLEMTDNLEMLDTLEML